MKTLFVSGTGTGVGKTVVTASMALYLQSLGYRVGVMKPFESGLSDLHLSDTDYYIKLLSLRDDKDLINPYRFQKALAPGVAARIEGVNIQLEKVKEAFDSLSLGKDIVFIEGAGGLHVPLSKKDDTFDLMRILRAPCFLVGRVDLGTLNHSLLSYEALQNRKIPLLGLLLNTLNPDPDESSKYNLETLDEKLNLNYLGTFAYLEKIDNRESLLNNLEANLKLFLSHFMES